MKTTRRNWLQAALCAGGFAASAGFSAALAQTASPVPRARVALNILVLGGTGFIGPNQIEYALARGHRVTMFNRGRSAAGMYGDRVETLIGDRDTRVGAGLKALEGSRRWDAVIDNSGYIPRHVRDSAELLEGRVGRYLYISSTSCYAPGGAAAIDERSPLIQLKDLSDERRTTASYGPFKAAGDQIVRTVYGRAAIAVRPTFIVGPGDDTGRFPYWVDRVYAGGDVLGPPEPGKEMRWVDVRDLCPWVITLLEAEASGAFNASAPTSIVTWESGLRDMAALASRPVTFHWPKAQVLHELGIDLPLAMYAGADGHIVNDASRAAGLRYRPFMDTTRSVLEWWNAQPSARKQAAAARWPSREMELKAIARVQRGAA